MRELTLAARSKIPDLAALTALSALRGPLDLPVLAVQREELWTIRHDGAESDVELMERLIHSTTLLVNPSKQAVRWGIELPEPLAGPPASQALRVEVFTAGEGARTLSRLQAAYPFAGVQEITRSLLWTLHLPADLPAVRDVLERAVVTTHRDAGLLVNPHYQDYRLIGP